MKIDTHQHFWQYQAADFPWISAASMPQLQRDFAPRDCQNDLASAGVQGVIAVQARSVAVETDFLLQQATLHPHVLGVIGWADLAAPDMEKRLDHWCIQPAFKGLRHILQDEPDVAHWVADPQRNRSLQIVQKRQLVYEVLVYHHQLPSVIEFCARHDAHWLVLNHAAKPPLGNQLDKAAARIQWAKGMGQLAALPHTLCKLSGLVTETDWQSNRQLTATSSHEILACFDTALDTFGPERLMFGSDWPVCELAAPYATVHALAETWAKSRLNAQQQLAFWGSTAQRCYGL